MWSRTPYLPKTMYQQRTLASAIERVSGAFPVVLVTGPRQVGKTTLLEHCVLLAEDVAAIPAGYL